MKRTLVTSMIGCSMLFSALPLAAQTITAYSHDSSPQMQDMDWMSPLKDTVNLYQLSIPGTHDTMSRNFGDIVQCQSMSLADQLNAGIRVIDIRLGPGRTANSLEAYHGSTQQGSFDGVMNDLQSFLTAHPREAVLMRVDNEAPNGKYYETGQQQLSSADFQTAFNTYWNSYHNLFYKGNNLGMNPWPALAEIRGKVLVLDDFSPQRTGLTTQFGFNYSSLNSQDDYTLNSNSDLYHKWTEVKAQLLSANATGISGNPDGTYFINYLSGSGGSFPYFVASGKSSSGTDAPQLMTGETTPGWNNYPDFPRVNCAGTLCSIEYLGTNYLTSNLLSIQAPPAPFVNNNLLPNLPVPTNLKYVGIVMADFPGSLLISQIVIRNSPYLANARF